MNNIRTQIDDNGRILIPANVRKHYKIKSGDVFVLRLIEGEMHFVSLSKVVAEAQALFRKHVPEGTKVVDNFLQERRDQARREQEDYDKYGG